MEKPAAARIHCQFYDKINAYSFHIANQASELALLESVGHFYNGLFEGIGEHRRGRDAYSVQNWGGLVANVKVGSWTGCCVAGPTSILQNCVIVSIPCGSSAGWIVGDGLRESVSIIIRALFYAVARVQGKDRVIEVKIGVVLCGPIHLSADGLIAGDSSEDFVGVAHRVGVDGAVHHSADAQQEQNTAEHISALSVVLIQRSSLHIFKIWLLFHLLGRLFLACHSMFSQ